MTFNSFNKERRGYAYAPDPMGRLDQGSWVKRPDPFGRILPEDEENETFDLTEPFSIKKTVGMSGLNRRQDVARVENLLGRSGDLDLSKTDGLTGYFGTRTDNAIKGFQKRNGLKVDGLIWKFGRFSSKRRRIIGGGEKPGIIVNLSLSYCKI